MFVPDQCEGDSAKLIRMCDIALMRHVREDSNMTFDQMSLVGSGTAKSILIVAAVTDHHVCVCILRVPHYREIELKEKPEKWGSIPLIDEIGRASCRERV